jgi:methylmalonyl-CoA mutase N-terminal domain/subunit
MAVSKDKIKEAYFEKPKTAHTWSGIPVKDIYTPEDVEGIDYKRDIADAGQYPYTRGIHSNMFKGRYWTKREVCGFGTPAQTNERLMIQLQEGVGGLNVIVDMPTRFGISVEHPLSEGEVGASGVPITSIEDMEVLTRDIPIGDVSFSLISSSCVAPIILSQYILVAQSQGLDISKLRGTIQNDTLQTRYCGMGEATPPELGLKLSVDIIEYCTKHMPLWNTINVNLYDLRETGITAPQEIAFGFANAIAYAEGALKRGLDIDDFAPRMAFYCSAHIDFLEEVAKLRAARRLWASIMKERFGAKNPKSWKFRFGVHTAGCSLVAQEPINNIIRVTIEALAAVMAGVQSLHCCSYDEPIELPTETAQRIALRTQQIIAYETGVATTADPLGGSYYIESLTDRMVEEATEILKQIDEMGGTLEAMKRKWIDNQIANGALNYQKEIENKERIVVGLNEFVSSTGEPPPGDIHRYSADSEKAHVDNVRSLKTGRDRQALQKAVERLRSEAGKGETHNLIPSIMEAITARATTDEIIGTIREAFGHRYDPFEMEESPFA